MMVVNKIAENPQLDELGIGAGSRLLSVNGKEVCDLLDWEYYTSADELILLFETESGEAIELEIDFEDLFDLGLEFEPDKVRVCNNRCVFCFVHQLPKGLRRALYVKDEDYRLSFRHGNYVTLTNISDEEFDKIVEFRLSPLYVSVHATDPGIRRLLLGNDEIPDIRDQLSRLLDAGIRIQAQIVLCPDLNDGDCLEQTISDLSAMHPGVESIAVVPVGLTAHRARLPNLKPVTPEYARATVRSLNGWGDRMLAERGNRFVFTADEFFLKAGIDMPDADYYEDYLQLENGVGMVRQLLDSDPSEELALDREFHIRVVTGTHIESILRGVLSRVWNSIEGLSFEVVPAGNILFGDSVGVSALLCGRDIASASKAAPGDFDCLIVPPDCRNDDGLFLDDLTIDELADRIGKSVLEADYSPALTMDAVLEKMGFK